MEPSKSNTAEAHQQAALRLPREIVATICDLVDNKTIKSLRLTCHFYLQTAVLRFGRVFISANPLNVEVFKAVASHETFRNQITEIIWDDATLSEGPRVPQNEVEAYYTEDEDDYDYDEQDDGEDEDGISWVGQVPKWYLKACKNNVFEFKSLKGEDVDRPDHLERAEQLASHMPMEESWAYYQTLLGQQRQVIASQAHVRALEDYICSFPALKRITITPAVHGRLFNPLFETPMIRAFPKGFNHPIPRGWPVTELAQLECPEWEDDGIDWQGFRAVTRALAQQKDEGRVTELRVDAGQLETGLNSHVFEQENETLHDFEAVLARPDFKHLHLDLMVDPHHRQADIFRAGLLKRSLSGAARGQGLAYLSFGTSVQIHGNGRCSNFYSPLGTIFDSISISRLQHFGLSRFYVRQDDLLSLLAALPQTLQTVDLCLIEFADGAGSYRTLLSQIRDTLGWGRRNPRPKLSISIDSLHSAQVRSVWIREELDEYLYADGRNPFGDDASAPGPNQIREGFGRMKDAFEPEYERPHVDIWTLAELGYLKQDDPPRPRPGQNPLAMRFNAMI